MKTVAWTIIALIAAGVLGAAIVVYTGTYNVAATQAHSAPVHWLLSTAQRQSVSARAGAYQAPSLDGQEMRAAGASAYDAMCVTCHGAPGKEPSVIGQGLNPAPPDLFTLAGERSPEELFWVVKHGIKMTGMPAFGPTHDDEELWSIVALVKALPGMGADTYAELAEGGGGHLHAGEETHGDGAKTGHDAEHGTTETPDPATAHENQEDHADHAHTHE
jgi:mono/diheme cytochrome c family protein